MGAQLAAARSHSTPRPVTGDVTSKAGRRTAGLPDPLVALLRTHRAEQDAERIRARQLWRDEVGCSPPIRQPARPGGRLSAGWLGKVAGEGTRTPNRPITGRHLVPHMVPTSDYRQRQFHVSRLKPLS